MLTNGGLRELDELAYNIVMTEENIYNNPTTGIALSRTLTTKRNLRSAKTLEADSYEFIGPTDDNDDASEDTFPYE
jgi:hypothetical protein